MASPTADFTKQVKELQKALQHLGELTKPNITTLKNLAKEFEKTRHKQENLTQVTKDLSKALGVDAKKAVAAYTKQLEKSRTASQKQVDALRKQKQSLDILAWKKRGEAIKKARIASKKAADADKKYADKIKILSDKLKEAGVSVKTFTIVNRKLIAQSKTSAVHQARLNREVSKAIKLHRMDASAVRGSTAAHITHAKGINGAIFGVRNLRNATGKGGAAFSVFRSKLLLASFAVGLLNKAIVDLVKTHGLQAAMEAKISATLIATGNAAGITKNKIVELSKTLQKHGAFSDETNLQVANMMLTYDKISGEVFPRALKAANDMAASLANGIPSVEDLSSKVTMLSKALQDPVRGMTALRKVGFSLSAQQEAQVRSFMAVSDITSAQNVILSASEKQYGDLANQLRGTTLGQINALSMAFGDLKERIGEALSGGVMPFISGAKNMTESLSVEKLESYVKTLFIVGSGLASYTIATKAATVATRALLGTLGPVGWAALAASLGIAITEFVGFGSATKDAGEEAKKFKEELDALTGSLGTLTKIEIESKFKSINNTYQRLRAITIDVTAENGVFKRSLGDIIDKFERAPDSFAGGEKALRKYLEAHNAGKLLDMHRSLGALNLELANSATFLTGYAGNLDQWNKAMVIVDKQVLKSAEGQKELLEVQLEQVKATKKGTEGLGVAFGETKRYSKAVTELEKKIAALNEKITGNIKYGKIQASISANIAKRIKENTFLTMQASKHTQRELDLTKLGIKSSQDKLKIDAQIAKLEKDKSVGGISDEMIKSINDTIAKHQEEIDQIDKNIAAEKELIENKHNLIDIMNGLEIAQQQHIASSDGIVTVAEKKNILILEYFKVQEAINSTLGDTVELEKKLLNVASQIMEADREAIKINQEKNVLLEMTEALEDNFFSIAEKKKVKLTELGNIEEELGHLSIKGNTNTLQYIHLALKRLEVDSEIYNLDRQVIKQTEANTIAQMKLQNVKKSALKGAGIDKDVINRLGIETEGFERLNSIKLQKKIIDEQLNNIAAQRLIVNANVLALDDEEIALLLKKIDLNKQLGDQMVQNIGKTISSVEAAIGAIESNWSAIDSKNKAEEMAEADKIKNSARRAREKERIEAKYEKLAESRAKRLKGWKTASAVSNVALGVTQTWRDPLIPNWLKWIIIPSQIAAGMAQVATIRGQEFEQGGLIGGRRHSQGGTIIEAEQGEFIMNRSAVNSIGTEALNRMNQGGGSSQVTVNISGNLLSSDYVEGELAEQIKNAIRRGTDFGIS